MSEVKKNHEEKNLLNKFHKGMDKESIKFSFANHLKYSLAKDHYSSTVMDNYYSLALTVRDRLIERWIKTQQTYHNQDVKRVYYLSLEFLMGRSLGNNLINLGFYDECYEAMHDLGYDLEDIREIEEDAGLGNGGLGRLAACYLDSMATLQLPGYGYGIRYEFGIFNQKINNGFQVELPDEWLRYGNPWEIERPEYTFEVKYYGNVEMRQDKDKQTNPAWVNYQTVLGVPYDYPIVGYKNSTVNNLRLWSAKASSEFDLSIFNEGDYVKAVESKNLSENISRVLYPNDNIIKGKELRLKQQYFFVSCSLQDIIRRFKKGHEDFTLLPEKVAIQLNDTHPSLGVAELMRILMDEEGLPWSAAWDITERTFAYTNHTLMAEALEKWPVSLFSYLLPRHLQIIYEINRRFLKQVSIQYPNNKYKLKELSIIEESNEKMVRMANLSIVGSHSVNGVAELHTDLLKKEIAKNFYEMYPHKFNNKTNGITPRRWLLKANRELSDLISEKIGEKWITKLDELKKIEEYAENEEFQKQFFEIKRNNKVKLSEIIKKECDITVNPDSIFDVQVKRIHEYKRQHLNALHIIMLYNKLKQNPDLDIYPQTFIIGGKAAPGYRMAKLIIKFINNIADVVNNDPTIKDKLKVVFLPNYRVSLAEKIIPATDISEQISTAGKEASGTGNMKFALNGALTVGTLDGANIEIREEVGEENIFIFGNTEQEISELRQSGDHDPWYYYNNNSEIKDAIDLIKNDFFSIDEPGIFQPIYENLMYSDPFFIFADLESYADTHMKANEEYKDRTIWGRKAIINVANMGKFSSDRSIHQYAKEIWNVKPVNIQL